MNFFTTISIDFSPTITTKIIFLFWNAEALSFEFVNSNFKWMFSMGTISKNLARAKEQMFWKKAKMYGGTIWFIKSQYFSLKLFFLFETGWWHGIAVPKIK